MPQAKKRVSRSRAPRVSRSNHTTSAVATRTLTNTKLALATLFLGFSSLAAAAASSTPMSAADAEKIAQRLAKQGVASSTPSTVTSTPSSASGTPATSSHVVLKFKKTFNTPDQILSPASNASSLANWEITALGKSISLRKFSVFVKSYAGPASISDFSDFKLSVSGLKPGLTQITSVLNPNTNIVTFVLPQPVEIPVFGSTPSSTGILTLSANVTGSGILSPAAIRAFEIAPDTISNLEAQDMSTGSILPPDQIWIGTDDIATKDLPLTGPAFLMHDVFPYVYGSYFGKDLEISKNAKIFKFGVHAFGPRDLTVEGINLSIQVNGLVAAGSAGTGTISNFRLYEAAPGGGLGQQIVSVSSTCLAAAKTTYEGAPCRAASSGTIYFNLSDNKSSPFVVQALTDRVLILVADTTNIFAGKVAGTITVNPSFSSQTGLKIGDNGYEKNWGNGGLIYSYTPVGGSKTGPFSALPGGSFQGTTLTKTL